MSEQDDPWKLLADEAGNVQVGDVVFRPDDPGRCRLFGGTGSSCPDCAAERAEDQDDRDDRDESGVEMQERGL